MLMAASMKQTSWPAGSVGAVILNGLGGYLHLDEIKGPDFLQGPLMKVRARKIIRKTLRGSPWPEYFVLLRGSIVRGVNKWAHLFTPRPIHTRFLY